jgi:hypothetical protein
MTQTFTFRILAGEESDSRVQTITSDVMSAINRQDDLEASIPVSTSRPGTKGDVQAIGTFLLQLLSSGAVIGLIPVILAKVKQNPKITYEIERANGDKFHLSAEQVSKTGEAHISEEVNTFLTGR